MRLDVQGMRANLSHRGSGVPPREGVLSRAENSKTTSLRKAFQGHKGARREHCSRNRQLEVKARADTTFADQELSRRLEESPGCSSTATDLDGGILEVLLKELNEKGRLYRESGYMSNAVEKPEELRVNAAEPGLESLHRQGAAQSGLLAPGRPQLDSHFPDSQERLQQHGSAVQTTSSVEEEDGEDSLGELTSSGDILGEDNMFTGGEDLQNKGKARKMRMVQAKQRVSCQRPGNDAVVADFVSQLRSYRSLKRELSSWTSAFLAEQGRAPRLADVEITQSAELEGKFREFCELRSVMLDASQNLRGKLESSALSQSGNSGHKEVVNANGNAGGSMGQGASRMAKALQYKQARMQHAAPSDNVNAAMATAEQSNGPAGETVKQSMEKVDFKTPAGVASASARVKNAMLAAAKYRKQTKEQAIAT